MKRVLRLGSVQGEQSLSVNAPLTGILEAPELAEITAQYGSRLRRKRGDLHAEISPPIPKEKIQSYGQALIGLVQKFEPGVDVEFKTDTRLQELDEADSSAEMEDFPEETNEAG